MRAAGRPGRLPGSRGEESWFLEMIEMTDEMFYNLTECPDCGVEQPQKKTKQGQRCSNPACESRVIVQRGTGRLMWWNDNWDPTA